ncbi:MAG: BrnA antitoxin family protein [candidate division KSB1 bacterium]|nr:BrnA antitoxin family protein [candidate division KSB1 bacterium]
MPKNKHKRDPLPEEFETIEEAAEFWDNHSLADYEDFQKEVDFEVDLKSEKNYFPIEKELSDAIQKAAKLKGVMPETLINLWLKEKVMESV